MSAPFGIEMYSSIDNYTVLDEAPSNMYWVAAPTPHPRFESYLVQAPPGYDIVWIKGVGRTFTDDAHGWEVRGAYDEVRNQLSRRYGDADETDWLVDGALWTEPRDWVMSITQKERFFHAKWGHPGNVLPNDLEVVLLGTNTSGSYDSWLILEYGSPRMASAEQAAQDDLSNLL
jgi:hypothetical protein